MSVLTAGTRVRSVGDGWARVEGTVRRASAAPPGFEGSGPWYIVRWDASPGFPSQEGPIESCNLERV